MLVWSWGELQALRRPDAGALAVALRECERRATWLSAQTLCTLLKVGGLISFSSDARRRMHEFML